jgi:hypothetical protein
MISASSRAMWHLRLTKASFELAFDERRGESLAHKVI